MISKDLSTAHIPSPHPEFGDEVRWTLHEYGWIVWVSQAALEEHEQHTMPDWLRPIMQDAVKEECILINFDQDANTCNRYKTYDW